MLIGRGALANYHDVPADAAADFDHWHTTEHLPERVSVPGFLRGRRYRALDAGISPEWFILYETADAEVLRSAPYVARLDDPTPWTARVSARMTRTIRTAARVRASAGRGAGGLVLAARLTADAATSARAAGPLGEPAMAALAARPGLCGAHVLEADATITGVDTEERQMRDPPDEIVPWMVLLEGTTREPLERAWAVLRAGLPPALRDDAESGIYALQAIVALCDV